ncbi:phage minor structural protein [Anaerotaenia torta]|uniref:phage tail spike protein n=1 Tax=Anaerotaenia torta TaxID=433293 RepID=UPI003D1CAC0B
MAIKSILTAQEDFTGEYAPTEKTGALWRFNEDAPDSSTALADSSGHNRRLTVSGWSGTTASLPLSRYGRYFRMNISNPATERTYLTASNDGSFFTNLGKRLVIGGWINPTTYSIGNTYCPLVSTRNGPGQPLFYLSLFNGRYRVMLYNSSGSLIHDRSEPTMQIPFVNGGWYFIATIIDIEASTVQSFIGNRADGVTWKTSVETFTGILNPACTANIVFGMLQTTYWYAGGLDDWFFETDSALTMDDLERHFLNAQMANGASSSANVDAWTEPGVVTLKATSGVYPASGELYTRAVECNLAGTGRVAVTSEYTAGVTSITSVETSTSDDMLNWTAWQLVDTSGALQSPNNEYIRFRVTLATTDTSRTPRLIEIQLHDIPIAVYQRLGFARPIVLDTSGAWEAVLENAYDILVTDEINGSDTLEFKLPFRDPKRSYLDNEKQVQVAGDIYRIRTLTDDKGSDGRVVTQVYAEAAFYDLSFSVEKEPQEYNAETAEAPMSYALLGTGWSLGTITVATRRTWTCSETSALAILRAAADIHGGDLIFDSANREVSLLTFSGKDSGALFSYRKNMKSIKRVVDTRSLVTRLYAIGKDGITFASINDGKPYVEDYTYSADLRISTLDLSSFTNPYQMLEFTQMRLAEYAKPRVSYVLSAMDLSVLTGYEHEAWDLGDTVLVQDKELNLTIRTRVIRREYNLQEPWKTVIELSTKLRELGDSTAAWDKAADMLSQVDVLDRREIKDMVPFNHMLNSRADNSLAYWLNSGFEVDTENGVSGTACFKAVGVSDMTKSLSQTIYPANRSSYTFSAQIASEDLEKGPNGQVGIQVIFEYEDGSTETRFIDLF